MTHSERIEETIKRAFDAGAVATAFGGLLNMLPAIATALSIVWMTIRIYETDTVQRQIVRVRAGVSGARARAAAVIQRIRGKRP